jgi:hypothetical protein
MLPALAPPQAPAHSPSTTRRWGRYPTEENHHPILERAPPAIFLSHMSPNRSLAFHDQTLRTLSYRGGPPSYPWTSAACHSPLPYVAKPVYIGGGVNDTVGHTTCPTCALKSHILQTQLTGHTTCETCALEITNWFIARFFVKITNHALGTWDQLDIFLHLTPCLKIMWYNFIFLIFGQG